MPSCACLNLGALAGASAALNDSPGRHHGPSADYSRPARRAANSCGGVLVLDVGMAAAIGYDMVHVENTFDIEWDISSTLDNGQNATAIAMGR